MAIATREDLQQHLQWAIELEHSTLPPYLTALYSIKDGSNTQGPNGTPAGSVQPLAKKKVTAKGAQLSIS